MRAIKTITISILALGLLAGSTVGVAAQDEEATTTSFTGTGTAGETVLSEGTLGVNPDGLNEATGVVYVIGLDSDDERLTGDATITANWQFPDPSDGLNQLAARAYEVTNEGGSWLGQSRSLMADDLGVQVEMAVLEGQDGYEGLTAYVHFDWNDDFTTNFSGLIFPGAGPEMPEPYAAE